MEHEGSSPYLQKPATDSYPEPDESTPSSYFRLVLILSVGRGSVFGIATGYWLDGPRIESRWGEIFCICPDRPWDPPSLLYNGYRVFPGGKERPVRDVDPSPPSSPVGHERVQLYLYSPYGPYGLYRASVRPVQRCTFNIILLYPHRYSSHIFPSNVSTKILHAFLFSPTRKYTIIKKERNILPPKFKKKIFECFPIT